MAETPIRPEGISIDAFSDVSTFRITKLRVQPRLDATVKCHCHERRPQRIQVNPQPGFALLRFDGTDLPPIRLKSGELSSVGSAIAGTETTVRGEDDG